MKWLWVGEHSSYIIMQTSYASEPPQTLPPPHYIYGPDTVYTPPCMTVHSLKIDLPFFNMQEIMQPYTTRWYTHYIYSSYAVVSVFSCVCRVSSALRTVPGMWCFTMFSPRTSSENSDWAVQWACRERCLHKPHHLYNRGVIMLISSKQNMIAIHLL